MKNWKRRFFVLRHGKQILYFVTEEVRTYCVLLAVLAPPLPTSLGAHRRLN